MSEASGKILRPLMLRTRFTVAVAAAVALVTLGITAVAFVVVRADLQDEVQHELGQQAAVVFRVARHFHGHIPAGWVPPHSNRFGVTSPYTQVVTAGGAVWASAADAGPLAGKQAAVQVAAGKRGAYYAEDKLDGVRAMVLTAPLAPGLAVQVAMPLNAVQGEVASVGATLALLSVIGVALAALAGWAVTRTGLAPVARLAALAERVTETGDPAGRVEVGRDDELGRLATSFNTMLQALQRSLAAQRQLISDASHELRTPMTSLRVNCELLVSAPQLPEPERQEVLGRIVAQVAELSQLVASVTELARGEAQSEPGQFPPGRCDDVPLHEVVAASLEGARRDWPRTAFTAELEPCVVAGQADRLGIAVRNLLDNAAKFGAPDGAVEVRLRAGELTVRDRGPGIAPDDLPQVFDRFYRAPAARAVPGSGLGLSIVRQVVERHGGSVEAGAAPDGGTLIRLRLPVSELPVSELPVSELPVSELPVVATAARRQPG
jgi:two-component system, OmpR family, sensor histidine kinase MprB